MGNSVLLGMQESTSPHAKTYETMCRTSTSGAYEIFNPLTEGLGVRKTTPNSSVICTWYLNASEIPSCSLNAWMTARWVNLAACRFSAEGEGFKGGFTPTTTPKNHKFVRFSSCTDW